jgi:predicted Rossmann-fold nucleotide-binding protein
VALPGGIGTLDEVFTVTASATIGFHHKAVVLYNIKGFWNQLIALLDDLQQRGMVRGEWQQYLKVASTQEELTTELTKLVHK